MNKLSTKPLVIAAAFVVTAPLHAQRELSTDRPDATESPHTVAQGRVQLEMSAAQYTRDRHNVEKSTEQVTLWNVAPLNVRVGLTQDTELQIVADGYLELEKEDRATGERQRTRGVGDLTLRAKKNLWGNDAGDTAFGVMPFIKLPTASDDLGNDSVEGGVIFPFAASLAGGWSFGAMTELDVVRNERDDGYTLAWVNTATIGRAVTERLGGFVELAAETGEGKPALGFNCGVTYGVNDDLQLDAGVSVGLTRAADDLAFFVGFAQRF
jgi:hypothetical protein